MKRIAAAIVLALSATSVHAAGAAQSGQPAGKTAEASVLVDVSKVADRLADELSIDVARIPPGVEVPVETAAGVCDETADMLAYAAQGGQQIGCEARNVSDDLVRALKEQLELRQDSGG